MTSSSTPEGGGVRATLRRFLKHDLSEESELSWLCQVHKDPAAMRLILRSRYVCDHCAREGAHPR
ncbi:hypothetical protein LRS74_23660 [Streptomyces sp. LX-29]|uniref:hypothetical protein n=1 Tax=Streptomyces sp. LX-29 TaxID=2900152 RepID=UPI00240E5C5B|nr:hypothetical protein [Streptomyces sp. LX-29]WFB09712.1 hypothetical protein LRS74_23660 [Streptomyces sp. LX-29]